MLSRGQEITIITIHVDDCMITVSKSLLQVVKDTLMAKFDMQDLSEAKSVLWMEMIQQQTKGKLRMKGYINKTLVVFSMVDLKPTVLLCHWEATLPGNCAIVCQPDIYYATHYFSHFVNRFLSEHYQAAK